VHKYKLTFLTISFKTQSSVHLSLFYQITKERKPFMCSSSALDAQLFNLKQNGKENETYNLLLNKSISKQLKATGVCSLSSPLSFLRNVCFHIVLFFCRRGREGQRDQQPKASTTCSWFSILWKTDPDLSSTNF